MGLSSEEIIENEGEIGDVMTNDFDISHGQTEKIDKINIVLQMESLQVISDEKKKFKEVIEQNDEKDNSEEFAILDDHSSIEMIDSDKKIGDVMTNDFDISHGQAEKID